MAIDSYETYIQKANNPNVKAELQRIQQEHKHHAAKISERIQNLGGRPVSGANVKGKIAGTMVNIKSMKQRSDTDLLVDAYMGEDLGIRAGFETVKSNLDPASRSLVNNIINQDQSHLDALKKLTDKP
jgi:bacterioferritin